MRHLRYFAATAAVCLAGCNSIQVQPKPQAEPSIAFDADELKAAMADGSSTIEGQGVLKTVGGEGKGGDGARGTMIGLTPYVRECLQIIQYANTGCFYNIQQGIRAETADAEGRFVFQRVKPGDYALETAIVWGIPTRYGMQQTGGPVSARVTVTADGQTVKVLLTR